MLRLAASRGGGPETRSGTVQSLKCPCQQKRAARLKSAAPGSMERGGPRNALGHRPEPEVLPLPAETSREAQKCCAWQHRGGGPETRSGTVQSLKCCPCQQKRAARLKSAAPGSIESGGAPKRARAPSRASPGSIEGGGPETRSGTVQSLKLGHRPEPEVLPLPAETSREAQKCCAWQHRGGGPRNALGHRPEPEVLPLPAETSREAQKCCAWQHREGGAPKRARAPSRA